MPQQILLNLNAFLIVVLVVPVSWAARKMRTLSAMLVGMSVATIGVLVAGLTGNGWVLLLGIVFFSLGEMWTGPKKNQYLGLIAPPGKKGLYLGYVNIPIGIGVGLGLDDCRPGIRQLWGKGHTRPQGARPPPGAARARGTVHRLERLAPPHSGFPSTSSATRP